MNDYTEKARDIACDFDCDWTADGRRRGETEERAAVESIATALREAHEAGRREQAQWRPIETAPRDGTQVQVFCPTYYPTYYQGKGGITWAVWLNGGWLDAQVRRCDPTHWMPLPAPPKAGD